MPGTKHDPVFRNTDTGKGICRCVRSVCDADASLAGHRAIEYSRVTAALLELGCRCRSWAQADKRLRIARGQFRSPLQTLPVGKGLESRYRHKCGSGVSVIGAAIKERHIGRYKNRACRWITWKTSSSALTADSINSRFYLSAFGEPSAQAFRRGMR